MVEGGSGRELERKLATSNIPGQNNRSKYQVSNSLKLLMTFFLVKMCNYLQVS